MTASATATVTVQELYDQSQQNNANILELKNSVDNFKTGLTDQINLIGIKNVAANILALISFLCGMYLWNAFMNYRNRDKIRRQRDKFVDNLKKENVLLVERQVLLNTENNLLRDNNVLLQGLFKTEVPKPKINYTIYALIGGITFILGIIITHFIQL